MNLKGAERHTSSLIKSPKLCKPRTRPMASHLTPSAPTRSARSGRLPSQVGAALRRPKQAPFKWKLKVCSVFKALAAVTASSLCSASSEPGPGRRSSPVHRGLSVVRVSYQPEGICTQDTSSSGPLMSSCRCRHIPRPGFTRKNSSKDNSCRTQRNPAGMTLNP